MSDLEEFWADVNSAPMEDRKEVIKFAARCRDQNRQYEINNNADLDNGVYHKFVYSSKDNATNEQRADESALLSRNSSRAQLPESRGNQKSTFQREREALKAEMKKGLKKGSTRDELSDYSDDDTISQPYEHHEILGKSLKASTCVVDESRIAVLADLGYPRKYIHRVLNNNEATYCLTGYYLLGIDQNY